MHPSSICALPPPPISIRNPNGAVMHSTHEAELDIAALPPHARHVHIVPALSSASLLSMGQLCDAGCKIAFDATDVTVYHNGNIVLTGKRTPATRLWTIDLNNSTPTPPAANAAIGSATPAELVAFAHAALFSSALSTLEAALN
jgi:hypothetical protein